MRYVLITRVLDIPEAALPRLTRQRRALCFAGCVANQRVFWRTR